MQCSNKKCRLTFIVVLPQVSVRMALRVAREGMSPTSLFGNLPRRVTN